MKKIGFIDYGIDEWHANNYPRFIRESSQAADFEVAFAWEKATALGKKNLQQWCEEQQVQPASSIEEVVAQSDCIIVLAPDHPESHEELADLPLKSGKPVYIDKPFAPTLAAAKRLFDKASAHKTPVMSCSALCFGSALETAVANKTGDFTFASTRGGGSNFAEYAIHQIEMVAMALGVGASRLMHCGNADADLMLIEYPDSRRAVVNLFDKAPFQITLRSGAQGAHPAQSVSIDTMNDFFPRFIEAMLTFFATGKPQVSAERTLEIAAILEAAIRGYGQRGVWHAVPSR